MENKIEKFKKFIDESQNIVFFGGAGVSTESGVPDMVIWTFSYKKIIMSLKEK